MVGDLQGSRDSNPRPSNPRWCITVVDLLFHQRSQASVWIFTSRETFLSRLIHGLVIITYSLSKFNYAHKGRRLPAA